MDIKAFYTSYYLQLLFYVNMYNFSKGKLKDNHNDFFKKKKWGELNLNQLFQKPIHQKYGTKQKKKSINLNLKVSLQ